MAGDGVPFGVWLVDKPAGPTSHDVVATVRRRLPRGTRVGHAGTLDPFATGLLMILVGRATRLVPYLVGLDKTYRARVRLGARSESGDPEGPIAATGLPIPDETAVRDAVRRLRGPGRQRVPALSAVRVDGERLHRRTRRGETTTLPERDIVIHAADVVACDLADGWVDIEIACSKGTYVRQVASDLGETLGCGGYCEKLRRLAVGALSVAEAVAPDDVAGRGGIDPRRAIGLPERTLSGPEAADVLHGRTVAGIADGPVALVADGELVGIAHPADGGRLQPRVVLR